jgi:polyisoprenoid-binding protein YceI
MSAIEDQGYEVSLPPAGNYGFDKAHTVVGFVARHMLTKVRGRFAAYDGEIQIAERPEDSTVRVEIEMASVATDHEQRDGHLRSADFFEIQLPLVRFEGRVRLAGQPLPSRVSLGSGTGDRATAVTDMQGRFEGWGPGMQEGSTVAAFSAKTTIDREDWDVTWNMAVETGGFLVSKKVDLEIDAELQPVG